VGADHIKRIQAFFVFTRPRVSTTTISSQSISIETHLHAFF
jgi:hypothetical protein